jgi:spore germination protein GerM
MSHRQPVTRLLPRHARSLRTGIAALVAALLLTIPLAACTMSPSLGTSTATSTSAEAGTTPTSTTGEATNASPTATLPPPGTIGTATSAATPTVATTPAPTPTPPPNSMTVSIYLLRDGKVATVHRAIAQTQQVGSESLKELFKGPSDAETSDGLTTAVPGGTTLLGLSIADKIATVNLSSGFASGDDQQSLTQRVAQVVYTLTQFDTVMTVRFQLDGNDVDAIGENDEVALKDPVGRSDFEDVTPAIFLDSPAPGDTVDNPVELIGTANTFEAAFTINILDSNGNVLTEQHAQATSGSGTRGTFDIKVPYKVDQKIAGTILLFEVSAKDGSKTNRVEVPVILTP